MGEGASPNSACPVARLMRSMATKLDEGGGGVSFYFTMLLCKAVNLPGKFYDTRLRDNFFLVCFILILRIVVRTIHTPSVLHNWPKKSANHGSRRRLLPIASPMGWRRPNSQCIAVQGLTYIRLVWASYVSSNMVE